MQLSCLKHREHPIQSVALRGGGYMVVMYMLVGPLG